MRVHCREGKEKFFQPKKSYMSKTDHETRNTKQVFQKQVSKKPVHCTLRRNYNSFQVNVSKYWKDILLSLIHI